MQYFFFWFPLSGNAGRGYPLPGSGPARLLPQCPNFERICQKLESRLLTQPPPLPCVCTHCQVRVKQGTMSAWSHKANVWMQPGLVGRQEICLLSPATLFFFFFFVGGQCVWFRSQPQQQDEDDYFKTASSVLILWCCCSYSTSPPHWFQQGSGRRNVQLEQQETFLVCMHNLLLPSALMTSCLLVSLAVLLFS